MTQRIRYNSRKRRAPRQRNRPGSNFHTEHRLFFIAPWRVKVPWVNRSTNIATGAKTVLRASACRWIGLDHLGVGLNLGKRASAAAKFVGLNVKSVQDLEVEVRKRFLFPGHFASPARVGADSRRKL